MHGLQTSKRLFDLLVVFVAHSFFINKDPFGKKLDPREYSRKEIGVSSSKYRIYTHGSIFESTTMKLDEIIGSGFEDPIRFTFKINIADSVVLEDYVPHTDEA